MPSQRLKSYFLPFLKLLGKVILGFFIFLLILLALLHLPATQRLLTRKVSDYLSTKMHTRVDVGQIGFSIRGNLAIRQVTVFDPTDKQILSAQTIEVTSKIIDLLRGELIFDGVRLNGLNGNLSENETGLNIQFIIEAFKPKEASLSKPGKLTLQLNSIVLEDILFQYSSSTKGVTLVVNLGTLTAEGAEFTFNPNEISAKDVDVENSTVTILSTQHSHSLNQANEAAEKRLFNTDFGTGIAFDFENLEVNHSNFSFHIDNVKNAERFDPSHIDLKNVHIGLSNVMAHEDTLAAALRSLAVDMPGFKLTDARTALQANSHRLTVSDIYLATASSEIKAQLHGSYDFTETIDEHKAGLIFDASASITPADFSYFINDSIMNHVADWEPMEVTAKGSYKNGRGDLNNFKLRTGDSELQVEGIIYNVLDDEKLSWKDVVINASLGSAFEKTLTQLTDVSVPPKSKVILRSDGNSEKINVDGMIPTEWGNIKVTGLIMPRAGDVGIDVTIKGDHVNVGRFVDSDDVGRVDLNLQTKGVIGDNTDIEINGSIDSIEFQQKLIRKVSLQSRILKSSAIALISIEDPVYRSTIASEISFSGPVVVTSDIQLKDFGLGSLLHLDSSLTISGAFNSKVKVDHSLVEGYLTGSRIQMRNTTTNDVLDTLSVDLTMSPTSSQFNYFMNEGKGNLAANFDIRELPAIIRPWSKHILNAADSVYSPSSNRTIKFDFQLQKAKPFLLLGLSNDIDDFSWLTLAGEFNEQKQAASLQSTVGKFKGYGVSLDTLTTDLTVLGDSISASANSTNLFYKDIQLGDLDFKVISKGDTAIANLLLIDDSLSILNFGGRILRSADGILVYPDKLMAFNNNYSINRKNPVYIDKGNIVLDHLMVSRDDIQISIDGDVNAFDLTLTNVDVTKLNRLFATDSAVINYGRLDAKILYTAGGKIDLVANIDSLCLLHSNPLTIAVKAISDKSHVPFEFLLTNESNKVNINGQYLTDTGDMDASVFVDVNDLEIFSFLVTGIIDEMSGSVKGRATISGPLKNPRVNGTLRFPNAAFTTSNPKLTFMVENDSIALDKSALLFKNFTMYDAEHNPLTINGKLTSPDYHSLRYDLHLQTDKYTIINTSDSTNNRLSGLLVVGSDIKLTANDQGTDVKARITVKDATALTLTASNDDVALLNSEGITDFIDPRLLIDSTHTGQSGYFYDSLIASLPDFNLNSTITIEDNASIRIYTDAQSGDFIEAAGAATLEMDYDRTGNVRLSGNYTMKQGVYRVSFYDLVKRNFSLVPGSSINWSGSPENGDLDIKALNTVRSSSIGLIGNEIGENEKSIYKRALPYNVGITIKGTLQKPLISFTLDLPQEERINYPVLANKLDRLKQPEFQSELNKQVFGVLVLGGFIPETSGSDINQSAIATTAISNSVNSLLSSQLNRFASQYIKGFDIDVGIQSYSDYAASGGKTQTAMDFRVTKRILDDRLSFEIGGDFNLNQDQSGAKTSDKNFRGDIAIIYDLTEQGNRKVKLFNNETYDIIYQEIRNTGISLIFIREFDKNRKSNAPPK